jgi:DNA polymerase-3 subunit delta'
LSGRIAAELRRSGADAGRTGNDMAFARIPGNAGIKSILRSALRRKRVPPTLLFAGPEGVGQRETALELAKALNCLQLVDDACDTCASCRTIEDGCHPDVIDVKKLPVKNDRHKNADSDEEAKEVTVIKIEQMREAIGLAAMKPMTARKRVFLIDDASEMSPDSANSSLKILEEPPSYAQFILITSNPDQLLPTIKSRCQTFDFGPISTEEMVAVLRQRGFAEGQARTMAQVVQGNYQRAMKMDWDDVQAERATAWELFRSMIRDEDGSAFVRRFAFGRKSASREELEATLELFVGFLRDLLLLGETDGSGRLFNPDFEDALREVASFLEPGRVLRMLSAVDGALYFLDKNMNAGLLAGTFYARMTGSQP